MKTRIRANKQKTSFQLDVVTKHVSESYFFKTEKAALDFQKFTLKLNEYKNYF
jgi:hypothetical protein